MRKYGFLFLLIGSFSWGQATSNSSASGTERPRDIIANAQLSFHIVGSAAESPAVGPSEPLITIVGLCDDPAEQVNVPTCTTIITRAQFEDVINAIEPNMRRHDRRQFALHYADVLVLAAKAEQMGLDKTPEFEEQMKLARIQTLSQALTKAIHEKASQISERDVESFYHDNLARFEKAEFDRLYIPRTNVPTAVEGPELNSANKIEDSQKLEQSAKKEADNLRFRALAGEGFAKLQADAYHAAGIKSTPPTTGVSLRRISLPPDQVSVMDLKPGDVSPVLADPNGYFIYRLRSKSTLSLDEVRNEITEALRTQRIHDETSEILDSAKSTLDESYFKR